MINMGTQLSDIQNKLKNELSNLQDTVPTPSGSRITVSGQTFVLPGGETSAKPLSVIILGWRWINRYYKNAYNANQIESPECYAIGTKPDDLAPMGGDDQQHTECKTCPMNQFGSNGRGKACRNSVRIALVSGDLKSGVVFLDVPPTSIASFRDLIYKFGAAGTHPLTAVTTIALDKSVTYPKFIFSAEALHECNLEQLDDLRKESEALFSGLNFDYN